MLDGNVPDAYKFAQTPCYENKDPQMHIYFEMRKKCVNFHYVCASWCWHQTFFCDIPKYA